MAETIHTSPSQVQIAQRPSLKKSNTPKRIREFQGLFFGNGISETSKAPSAFAGAGRIVIFCPQRAAPPRHSPAKSSALLVAFTASRMIWREQRAIRIFIFVGPRSL